MCASAVEAQACYSGSLVHRLKGTASKHRFYTNIINLWISVSIFLYLETNSVRAGLAWNANHYRFLCLMLKLLVNKLFLLPAYHFVVFKDSDLFSYSHFIYGQ